MNDEYLNSLYHKYIFISKNYDEFLSIVLLDCNNIDDENTLKVKINSNIEDRIVYMVNINSFTSVFLSAVKSMNAIDAFNLFDKLINQGRIKLNEIKTDYIGRICDSRQLHKFYEEYIEENNINVDNMSIKNNLLSQVLEIYILAKNADKYVIDTEYLLDDSLKLFINDIKDIPLLSSEEEYNLFKKMQDTKLKMQEVLKSIEDTDEDIEELKNKYEVLKKEQREIINTIELSNVKLVMKIAKSHVNRTKCLETIDLIQEGILGLEQAIIRFEVDKGFKFSTYATYWIKQAIGRKTDYNENILYVPMHQFSKIRKVRKAQRFYQTKGIDDPTDEEISSYTGLEIKEIIEVKALMNNYTSLDIKMQNGDPDADTIGSFVEDEDNSGFNFNEMSYTISWNEDVHKAISELDPRLQEIIKYRYGMDGRENITLEDLGKKIGCSREWVRKLEVKALEELKINLAKYAPEGMYVPKKINYAVDFENPDNKTIDTSHKIKRFNNFVLKLNEANPNIDVIKYNPYTNLALFSCNKCKREFYMKPQDLTKKSYKCDRCKYLNRIAKYQDEIDKKNPDIIILDFNKKDRKGTFICNNCNTVWNSVLAYMVNKPHCPNCDRVRKRTKTEE